MTRKLNPLFKLLLTETSRLLSTLIVLLTFALVAGDCPALQNDAPQDQNAVEKQTADEAEEGPRDDIQSTEPDPEDTDPDEARSWRELARASEPVRQAFKSVIAQAGRATVEVRSAKGEVLAMGTIVDPDGKVLTKASEMHGELVCRLQDGRELPATVMGIHMDTDLALLKVEAKDLPAVSWSQDPAILPVGSWLVTPDIADLPIAVGVVSVVARKVSPGGVLGVFLEDHESGVRIDRVISDSPAEEVDIRVNDIVIEVNGTKTDTREKLIAKVREYGPGDRIEVVVMRGDQRLTFRPVLGRRALLEEIGQDQRSNIQNRMGSELSGRRTGFAAVIQHDTMLAPNQCGGVVVDINGEAVGVNIARSGRIMSYALPAATVVPILKQLLAGELSPEIVHKTRLQIIRDELADLDTTEKELPDQTARLEAEVGKIAKTVDALKESIDQAEQKLKQAKAELEKSENERSDLARELRTAKRSLRRIEITREKLLAEQKALKKGTFPETTED